MNIRNLLYLFYLYDHQLASQCRPLHPEMDLGQLGRTPTRNRLFP